MRTFFLRRSVIHGRRVFAAAVIAGGDYLLEYKGEVLSQRKADRRFANRKAEAGHTFSLARVVSTDGANARAMQTLIAGNIDSDECNVLHLSPPCNRNWRRIQFG
jgi:hypothetical protein